MTVEFSSSTPTPEEVERDRETGRVLFAGEFNFVFGAQKLGQLPDPILPEIAFAGRSNVGKSSLINALTGRRALARASSEPGRTKQLNFFEMAHRLTLVDMPGYGFAKAARAVKEDWQGMMFSYLRGRPTLRRVVLLLDSRVEVKASDREIMKMLDRAAVTFQVVLTKCDVPKPNALAAKLREVSEIVATHAAAFPHVLATSSETGLGIEDLRAELARLANPPA
ncbi:YihA family ribosome biogenesis GTP-binding protein [Komagataeibacter rhaeticus]|uniref:Probable GTP-binding protein EngB n=1 Tax=Komagataeibacter rhaeticus TaxID=215221 RepID=A0A858JGN8_9PROT|nr:ribosome biogenesis GTP-binding protein YihA/YsxC [Komagataeibacter rhaeticus]ATU73472.1 YihA family ribosome biogenesis GTP-binding protein [Komagataeibacter xylinus]KDU95420.1 GTP-binding protein [Komagataeibacter rhaeticus AF1]MBL7239904.1 YihA family ribosome biogenesis GTP-binding protein [Komagataeibacter rhaeticus]PYD54086.1 YihA family ribosome biogenesis GTP-binding protein [Komagataeibacter rhaeticus]QIP34694.1 YihA family ribosome biogenesis GTP-binding protein [Komagataeibacter 